MHKLTVTLKQHTPLIHFQHDQEGATLRASEVKPKLDKFILTKLGNGKYEAGIEQAKSNGWLVGKGDHPALDYKMRIITRDIPDEFLIGSLIPNGARNKTITVLNETPFFAQEAINVSKKEEECPVFLKNGSGRDATYTFIEDNWNSIDKKGLMWNNISIDFFSLNSDLLSSVKENIAVFFICTNFGTRSTKGFGSFTVEKINEEEVNIAVNDVLGKIFKFAYSKEIQGGLFQVFKNIKEDYQIIKAGVNTPETKFSKGKYIKSILFCYAVEKMGNNNHSEIRWEKRFFKRQMKDKLDRDSLKYKNDPIRDAEGTKSWEDPQNGYDYRYLRSVLGVAEQYEFLLNDIWNEKKKKNVPNPNKAKVKVKSKEIERYGSPILFKVIGNSIYIVGNDVDSNILGKSFSFSYSKGNQTINVEDGSKTLKTPSEFDLADFMNYAMGERFKLGYTKIK